VIGFLADSWGHKIGKKRLSFMGLRPRHTATLVTVGAGVLIPLVTVLIVAVLSSGVRTWLFEGQAALEKLREVQQTVDDLQTQRDRLSSEIQRKSEQAKAVDAKLKQTEKRVTEFAAKAERFQREAAGAAARATGLAGRLTALNEQFRAKQQDLATAKAGLAAKKKELDLLTKTSAEAYKQLDEEQKESLRLGDVDKRLSTDLEDRKKEIADLQAQKEKAGADLAKAQGDLKAEIAQMDIAEKKFGDDIAAAAARLAEARAQLGKAQLELAGLESLVDFSRTHPMIMKIDDEVARLPLLPNRSAAEAASAVQTLLRTARVYAEHVGAKASPARPIAGLWPQHVDGRTIGVVEQEEGFATSVTRESEHCVLIAYASSNVFSGEPVPLYVKIWHNPLVYKTGQVIARAQIDGRLSEKEIRDALDTFIRVQVSKQAREDHMIPIQGREDALGSVPAEDILDAVRKMKDVGIRVVVHAEAAQDTRAADTLKLKLTIR